MTACRVYVRVSTDQQELSSQLAALQEAAKALNLPVVVYPEKVSGNAEVRDQYNKLLRDAMRGDHVFVWALDRFSRSDRFTDATNEVLDLEKRGIIFHSLEEPMVNTPTEDSFGRDALLALLPVIAKFENKRRSRRIRLAMDDIKAGTRKTKSGRPPGRPRRITPDKEAEVATLRATGMAYKAIA